MLGQIEPIRLVQGLFTNCSKIEGSMRKMCFTVYGPVEYEKKGQTVVVQRKKWSMLDTFTAEGSSWICQSKFEQFFVVAGKAIPKNSHGDPVPARAFFKIYTHASGSVHLDRPLFAYEIGENVHYDFEPDGVKEDQVLGTVALSTETRVLNSTNRKQYGSMKRAIPVIVNGIEVGYIVRETYSIGGKVTAQGFELICPIQLNFRLSSALEALIENSLVQETNRYTVEQIRDSEYSPTAMDLLLN